jgi:predicted MFS family arabinose efflux permease
MSISKSDVSLMSIATGLIVANLYYCQPLVVLISKEFLIPENQAATITYLTQAGYAIGMFFMVPLGDKLERKKQIQFTTFFAIVALVLAATAKNFLMLQIASFLIGAFSIVPQLILPLAASLASSEQRGKVIGTIMSGLLIGILISRTISGFVGLWIGWRGMFWIAASFCLVIMFVIQKKFPINRPSFKGSYFKLLNSMFTLIKEQKLLREATLINAVSFAQFGAFWTTMVLLLSGKPFYYNSATIGLFGIVGAFGAIAAPLVGKLSDTGNPRKAIGYGCVLLLLSFIIFYFSAESLVGILIGIVFIDVGLQAVHVSNQTRIYALLPEARNRMNTVFMSFSFLGTALGSALGLWLWTYGKWHAFLIGGAILSVTGIVIYLITYKRK